MPDYWDKNVTCDDAAAGAVTMVTMARGSGDRKLDNTRPAQRSRTRDVVLSRGPREWGISNIVKHTNILELTVLDMNDETVKV